MGREKDQGVYSLTLHRQSILSVSGIRMTLRPKKEGPSSGDMFLFFLTPPLPIGRGGRGVKRNAPWEPSRRIPRRLPP